MDLGEDWSNAGRDVGSGGAARVTGEWHGPPATLACEQAHQGPQRYVAVTSGCSAVQVGPISTGGYVALQAGGLDNEAKEACCKWPPRAAAKCSNQNASHRLQQTGTALTVSAKTFSDRAATSYGSDAYHRKRATSVPERAETTVTSGQPRVPRTTSGLGTHRLTRCLKRPPEV